MFALVVHTIQTALVILLGAWGWADLNRMEAKPADVIAEAPGSN